MTLAPSIMFGGKTAVLVCHMAALSGRQRPNSRAAMRECFDAGVARVEIDVHSLDGPDYIVSHERRLEREMSGSGSIGAATPHTVRALRFLDDADDRPMLLSEVVEMARGCASEVQLDLKDWRPLSESRVRALIDTIEPIAERVIVSSMQDWNLRLLRRADPTLAVGFDPGHYLDYAVEEGPVFLPRTMGAYGYRDDHPMAVGRTEPAAGYLRERMEMLVLQSPGACELFLSFRLFLQMLGDGFNAAAWLHERGIDVTAWTPDYRGPDSLRPIERLIDAGVARITTNTAPAWVEAFAGTGTTKSTKGREG
ncbi:MAG: glycerophosphodiester phosphodiesterase family protein, partial [Chloroflexota bacterium]